VEVIRGSGLKAAVGSASKYAREVIDRLGIDNLFDAIADGYSVKLQKPSPDLFLHAAAQLELNPSECVVVEDAAAGIEAARSGGFLSIGLGPRERVARADLILPNLEYVHLQDLRDRLDSSSAL
jgi:beta-phosphoglucomutase-like phosphatase (HAD superfamily)